MSLLLSYIMTSIGQVVGLGSTLISRILLARFLGPAQYGGFGVGLNTITVLSRVFAFGIVPATQFYGSKKEVAKQDFLKTVLSLSVILAILITVVSVILVPILMHDYWVKQPFGFQVFYLMAPFIGIILLGNVLSIILIPWNKVFQYSVIQVLSGALIPLAFTIGILWWEPLTAANLSQILVWIIVLVYCFYLVRKEIWGGKYNSILASKVIKYGLVIWPNVILNIGTARLATLFGANFISNKDMGLFVVALNVSEAIFGFHSGFGQLLLSRVSEQESKSFQVMQQSVRISLLLLVIVAIFFVILGKPLLILFFGKNYAFSWNISLILLVLGISHTLGRIFINFMAGIGKPSLTTIILGVELLVLIIFIPVLAKHLGVIGLAWASVTAATLSLILSSIFTMKITNCNISSLYLVKIEDLKMLISQIRSLLIHK